MIVEEFPLVFPQSIDSSTLTAFKTCHFLAAAKYLGQRTSPNSLGIHLHAGGAFADLMEQTRTLVYGKAQMSVEDALQACYLRFVKRWGDIDPPAGVYKDFINVWSAVEYYWQVYHPDRDDLKPLIQMHDDEPAVEFRFSVPLPIAHPDTGDPLLYSGRIDMLGERNGLLYAVDDKTTGAMGDKWAAQWKMRWQFLAYLWALRELGYNPAGFLVRGLCIQQTQFKHMEVPVAFHQRTFDLWHMNMLHQLESLVAAYQHSKSLWPDPSCWQVWGRAFGQCCEHCEMIEPCTADDPWDVLDSWPVRFWNPTLKDPTSGSPAAEDITWTLPFDLSN